MSQKKDKKVTKKRFKRPKNTKKALETTVNVARHDLGQHFNSTLASILTLKMA